MVKGSNPFRPVYIDVEGVIAKMKKKFDVTKHLLVPKHIKVYEREKQEILKKYNITVKELPKILLNDPSIDHLDVKVDDVIKIQRKSPTAGEVVFYRCVVND